MKERVAEGPSSVRGEGRGCNFDILAETILALITIALGWAPLGPVSFSSFNDTVLGMRYIVVTRETKK